MARPSKLSPEQWDRIAARLAAGEVLRDLAKEYGVSPAAISKRSFTKQSKRVQETAQMVANAQTALASHPVHEQYVVLSLADEIRGLQTDVLAGTRLSAKSGLRLHFLANAELQKVDDAAVLTDEKSVAALKTVAVLTKMGNEAMAPALTLLAANKERVNRMDDAPEGAETQQQHGVLVVPGMEMSAEDWSNQARGAKE
jgi:hypothetical protein